MWLLLTTVTMSTMMSRNPRRHILSRLKSGQTNAKCRRQSFCFVFKEMIFRIDHQREDFILSVCLVCMEDCVSRLVTLHKPATALMQKMGEEKAL